MKKSTKQEYWSYSLIRDTTRRTVNFHLRVRDRDLAALARIHQIRGLQLKKREQVLVVQEQVLPGNIQSRKIQLKKLSSQSVSY